MEIELTQGFVSVVDDDDYPLVRDFKWRALNSRGFVYAARSVGRSAVLMHRVIAGAKPGQIVDHIDHDTLNNRRANLRVCTHAEIMRNSKFRSHSRTVIKVVMLEKHGCRYRFLATVRHDNKRYRKWFATLEDATKWAEEKRKELHGEFAYLPEMDVRS